MKFNKKIVLSVAMIVFALLSSQAQTGIGITNPDNSAQLDVSSDKRGFLMPRVNLVKTTDKSPAVGTPAKSLMVYNTATNEDVTPGFYFWDGTKWARIAETAAIPQEPWLDAATDKEATANTQNIYQMGNVGIGMSPLDGVALGIKGVARIGEDMQGYGFGIQGNRSMAIGYNLVLSGENSFLAGRNIEVVGDNAMAMGYGGGTWESNTFVAGVQGFILPTYGGGADGSAVFGWGNAIETAKGMSSTMRGNTIFGAVNKIEATAGGTAILSQNAVFGSSNFIRSDGNANTIENVTIFGKLNTTDFAGKGAITGTTIFGYNNKASNSNQFVIGSQNENAANALFEIGMGTIVNQRLNAVTVLNNGSVGIATSSPAAAYKLYVNGQAGGTSAWTQSSDRRYKTDITPITGALDKIMHIQGVGYNWRTSEFKDMNFDSKHQLGVIAQDIEKILPDAVTKDDKGYYSVSYTTLVPVLVEAVKEQQKTIAENHEKMITMEKNDTEQTETIKKQQKKITDMESRLLKLEKQIK